MGWDALKLWGEDAERVEKLTGGVANDVWRVHVGGEIAVGRLGRRSDADLAWEAALLQHLDRNGMSVLIVEQNVHAVLALAQRAYILEGGRIVSAGEARKLLDDDHVRTAYLGPLAG